MLFHSKRLHVNPFRGGFVESAQKHLKNKKKMKKKPELYIIKELKLLNMKKYENKENINLNVFYSTANLFQTSCYKVVVCCRNVFAVTADVSLEHDQKNLFSAECIGKL